MSGALELFGIMMAIFLPISMLVFVNQYWDYKNKTSSRLGKLQQQIEQQSTEELKQELAALKERIVVLESIVTDRRHDLEQKIGEL